MKDELPQCIDTLIFVSNIIAYSEAIDTFKPEVVSDRSGSEASTVTN